MSSVRKNYSGVFKSQVAIEALKGDLTLSAISTKYNIHPTQVMKWKKQALEGMSAVFSDKAKKHAVSHDVEIKNLHAKIGQLLVEKDFLLRASGR